MQQLLLFLIELGVPLLCFGLKKPQWAAAWVGFTLCVNIFDTRLLTNLPAGRLVGLVYLPWAMQDAVNWVRYKAVAAFAANVGLMLISAVFFGFIVPWQVVEAHPIFSLTPHGRVLVFLVRTAADFSLTIFLARQLVKPGALLLLGRAVVAGATVSVLAGLPNLVFRGFDPFYLITGLHSLGGIQLIRSRGLSYEPRSLGMACAYAIAVLLVYPAIPLTRRVTLLFLNVMGVIITFSSSGFGLVILAVLVLWLRMKKRMRAVLIMAVACIPFLLILLGAVMPDRLRLAELIVAEHFNGKELQGAQPQNLGEAIGWHLDAFDAAAFVFLYSNPLYILTGTGPGMVLIPAAGYITPGIFTEMYGGKGLNGLPTLGPLLEVSNTGLIGLLLWAAQIWLLLNALKKMLCRTAGTQRHTEWRFGYDMFLAATAFYLIQVSNFSPYWAVFLAIGWAATREVCSLPPSPALTTDQE